MVSVVHQLRKFLPRLTRDPIISIMAKEQQALIREMVTHVPFDGWTQTALKHAARRIDMPVEEALSYFPHANRSDFITLASRDLDIQMKEALLREMATAKKKRKPMGTTASVQRALEIRMELEQEHFTAANRAFSYLILPHNITSGLHLAWETCDCIWTILGSDRQDPAYQSKRSILLGVYVSTWLAWHGRGQPRIDFCRRFLSRQLARSMRLGRWSRGKKIPDISSLLKSISGLANPEYRRFRNSRRGL